jgi:putative ABC transport system permease protein
MAATKGPDVVAYMPSPSQAKALVHARGVTASSGPYPITSATLHVDGRTAGAFVEGRSEALPAVDQPDVLSGSCARPGGVLLERTFAEALGVSVGGRVTFERPFVRGDRDHRHRCAAPYPNLSYTTVNIHRGSFQLENGTAGQ